MSLNRIHVAPETVKALSVRSDFKGMLFFCLHVSIVMLVGLLFVLALSCGWYFSAFIILLLYGTCFSFLGWAGLSHELSHGTVFKATYLNKVTLSIVSFLLWNNKSYFKYSHALHHKFTLNSAKDYEVRIPVKVNKSLLILGFFSGIHDFYKVFGYTLKNAFNIVEGPLANSIFERGGSKRKKLVQDARIILSGHMALCIIFLLFNIPELIILTTFGNFISPSLSKMLGFCQHIRMQSDVDDLRLSTRTIIIPRFLAFFYWNMNYHLEHHAYPNVPFYNLPLLHEELKCSTPAPVVGFFNTVNLLFK